jgi:choline dehydrogenase-like flavoprotein
LGVNEGRVTALGGATNTWGGGLIRLSEADFEPLAGRPDTAWPITYESIVPHYRAVEQLFGVPSKEEGCGEVVFEDATNVIAPQGVRVKRRPIAVLPFRGKNFAHRFASTLEARPNVKIICGATIDRVYSGTTGVSTLQVCTEGCPPRRISASRYVIAAGVVNSVQLAREVLTAAGLETRAGTVGDFFHDHLSLPIARLHPRSPWNFSRRFGYAFHDGLMFGEHFDIESIANRQPGAFLHLAFDTAGSSVLRPVRSILNAVQRGTMTRVDAPSLADIATMLLGLPQLGIMRYGFGRLFLDEGTHILATLDLEQMPERGSTLRGGGTSTTLSWDASAADAQQAADLIPVCKIILERLRREAEFQVEMLVPDPADDPEGFRAHFRRASKDTFHCAGGLRMGNATEAIVDSDLRLRGVPNTHVLSSAVFPRVGTSNPTLTILALAHRLAMQLKQRRPFDNLSEPAIGG